MSPVLRRVRLAAVTMLTAAALLSPGLLTASATTPPTAVAAAVPAPIKGAIYRGKGDDVIRIQRTKLPGIITLTHTGTSNFIVHALDLRGVKGMYLVNEIGRYRGTRTFNTDYFSRDGISGLEIKADGAWTVMVRPITSARRWRGASITGRGDDVLLLSPAVPRTGLHTLSAAHNGSRNFIVHPITSGLTGSYLINEIGRYRGKVRLAQGMQFLDVQADGAWSFTRR